MLPGQLIERQQLGFGGLQQPGHLGRDGLEAVDHLAQPTGAEVTDQLDKIAAMLAPKFPAVARMLADAREDLTAFASFPSEHWTKLWSTNPLERVNKEIKRRTNVVGIFLRDCLPPSAVARLRQAS